jgi:hypothetical protein
MERYELEQWLCGADTFPPAISEMAVALGVPVDAFADTTLFRTAARVEAVRFTLAVLRDAFADDMDVWRWLETSRAELNGVSPRSALIAGSGEQVSALVVETWNESIRLAGAA